VSRKTNLEHPSEPLGIAIWTRAEARGISSTLTVPFIARKVQAWLAEKKIRTRYIDPGSPWQSGYLKSFHGRFRDECLNREHFFMMTEARMVIGDYREEYNRVRPHGGLGYLSSEEFVARQSQDRQVPLETLNPKSNPPGLTHHMAPIRGSNQSLCVTRDPGPLG
jgi:transposase InsO family protein